MSLSVVTIDCVIGKSVVVGVVAFVFVFLARFIYFSLLF